MILLMLIIVVIVYVVQGKPVPKWMKIVILLLLISQLVTLLVEMWAVSL